MAQKIGAAVQASRDRDFLMGARIDARAVEGLDGAVKRARAYVDAGADAIFPEALESVEEFKVFAQALKKEGMTVPLVANMTEFGKTPYMTIKEFETLGYRLVLFPVTALRVATKAIEAMLDELRSPGSQQRPLDKMQIRQQPYELLRYAANEEWDEDIEKRYGR